MSLRVRSWPGLGPKPSFWAWLAALLLCVSALGGCAGGAPLVAHDPLEPLNRQVFKFNDALDTAIVKPVAIAYRDHTPTPLRQGIGNVFNNLQDSWSVVNNLLQLKTDYAYDSLVRVAINTLLGVGGVVDVASELGIERHTQDFGHTLGVWGVPPGPYLVLPILGPSSMRDALALSVDWQGDPLGQLPNEPVRNAALLLRGLDTRAGLLKATSMLEEAALDRYTFARDAFLQNRRNNIFDGNPPQDDAMPGQ
jgi:phospholipid-binding lipoprotein MlaA